MSARLELVACLVTALGCGTSGGVFFAFSTLVMPALGRLPSAAGVAAMQAINVAAIDAVFLGVLFGAGVATAGLAAVALARCPDAGTWLVVVAAGVYLVGALGTTMACHVPLNDALAGVDPESAEAASLFARYLARWTAWNHVRAASAIVATALLVLSVAARSGAPWSSAVAARVALGLGAP